MKVSERMCIFCRIATRELPASIVYEDEFTIAFLDIQPVTSGHTLVIPKTHVSLVIDLSDEIAGHLFRVGKLIDAALRASDLRCEGVNFYLADGWAAGQDVNHVHLHVFPRFAGDGVVLQLHQNSKQPAKREQLFEDAQNIIRSIEKIV